MSVAFIYLATRVPSMLGNASPFDSWLQTLYFGFSLPRPMARSISSLGLVAGTQRECVHSDPGSRAHRRPATGAEHQAPSALAIALRTTETEVSRCG